MLTKKDLEKMRIQLTLKRNPMYNSVSQSSKILNTNEI